MLGKLPTPVCRNLARDNDQIKWTRDDLQTAIWKEIRVLECGLYATASPSSAPTSRAHATASFHASIKGGRPSTNTVRKKLQCAYCKGDHSPNTCTEVTDYQKRLEIVHKANLCFNNCLGNHKMSQCNSKFWCKLCKHKHHTSWFKPADISSGTQGSNTPVTLTSQSSQATPAQTTQTTPTTQSSQVGAHAAPVLRDFSQITISEDSYCPCYCEGVRIHRKIVFDEGSQHSFITEETANQLKLSRVKKDNVAIAPFGAEYSTPQATSVGQIHIATSSGDRISISVLIVPFRFMRIYFKRFYNKILCCKKWSHMLLAYLFCQNFGLIGISLVNTANDWLQCNWSCVCVFMTMSSSIKVSFCC